MFARHASQYAKVEGKLSHLKSQLSVPEDCVPMQQVLAVIACDFDG